MGKWIRWKGLIAFVGIVGFLAVFAIVFIDSIIRNSIEYTGTRLVGARVELNDANLSFSPLGIRLSRLQVTNPDVPMQNIVDIRQISFNMDSLNILRRKALINEMRVEGVRFNTQRKKSGAISKKPEPAQKTPAKSSKDESGFNMPAVTIPNVDDVLGREEIRTLGLAKGFKQDTQTNKDNWKKIVDGLPGEKQVDAYKARLDKVKQTNTKDARAIVEAIKELGRLKKDIKTDIDTVESSRNQISSDLKQLGDDYKNLKKSPQQEYDRITKKYSVSASGVGNISFLLFGQEAKKYTDMAMAWYKKIEPYMAYVDFSGGKEPEVDRHKGLDIRFKEYNPMPDFLVRVAHLSLETEKGNFNGKVFGITGEQDITRKPVTLKFTGNKMQGIGSLLITGTFNHINPSKAEDQVNVNISNYEMDKYRLIDRDDMTIYLDRARSDIKLVAQRENKNIKADFRSHIHSIKYNNKASGNELAMMVLGSINKTRDFNVYGKLRGTFDKYSTSVSSDLDNRLKANMDAHINRRLAGFRKQLKDKIHLKTRQPLQDAENKYKDLNSMVKNDIALRKAQLTQQYQAAADELKRKQQDKKNQLKGKLGNKLKNLLDKRK